MAPDLCARTLADRYKPLVEQQAISKQDYTNAVAQARQAEASVAQNTAALRSAQINQRFYTDYGIPRHMFFVEDLLRTTDTRF